MDRISERADRFVKKYVKEKPEPDLRPAQIKVAEVINKHSQSLREARDKYRTTKNG